jgi:catechol 2,3-dioxygenase-like lactoylglutathione lyase family enzyme
MQANEILETCLYVDDLDAAERFYRDVLGLVFVSRQEGRHVFFRCGQRMLLLFNPDESSLASSDLPPHGSRGAGHVAFAVPDDELDAWRIHLNAARVQIEKTIDWPQGGRSFYFRDPAGNSLELATPRIWGIEEASAMS